MEPSSTQYSSLQPQDQEKGQEHNSASMQDLNQMGEVEDLNMKVAALLNEDQEMVPSLSAAQCHAVINIFKRMQRARDAEILQLIKPFTECLDNLIPRMDAWKSLCERSKYLEPHAQLKFKLETATKTDMGMKPGSFVLEGDALLTIEASNKILRALAIEKKYCGLSKSMAELKQNVKQMMADIQKLLEFILTSAEPVPGARFFSSDQLDAKQGRVILRNGRPFYVDPKSDDLIFCPPRHPLLRAPGSEWNKWFRISHHKGVTGMSRAMRIHIPSGPLRQLRQEFIEARFVQAENEMAQFWAMRGTFFTIAQEKEFYDFVRKMQARDRDMEEEVDIDNLETPNWDMSTYLKFLDHKKVDYTHSQDYKQNGSQYQAQGEFKEMYSPHITFGGEFRNLMHPGYTDIMRAADERINHPCDFSLFEELEGDFSKMRLTPEEINATLTPYLYNDADMGYGSDDDSTTQDECGDVFPEAEFSQEGLYLDTKRETMTLRNFFFLRPEFRRQNR